MPRRCRYAEKVENKNPRILKFERDDGKGFVGVSGDRIAVGFQSGNCAEPQIQKVKQDKEKQKHARNALEKVKPVAPVAVIKSVRAHLSRNKHSVNRMKDERQENAENFDEQQIRNMVYVGNAVVKNLRAAHRLRVREQMHEKERAQRHDARQLMQLSHHKRPADFYRHSLEASREF